MIAFARQALRPAHHVDAAKLAVAGRKPTFACNWRIVYVELHIPGNEQIKPAIVIVVSPGRAGGPSAYRDARFLGDIGKGSIMIVVIKAVLAKVRDVEIRPPVIVIVGDRDSESPALV